MAKGRVAAKLARLQVLAASEDEQAAYAAQLLEEESHPEVVQAALEVLESKVEPLWHGPKLIDLALLRPQLVRLYQEYDEGTIGPDSGCYVRVAILRALRHIALVAD